MASGYSKSKVVSVTNNTKNSGAVGVDLVFGDVVALAAGYQIDGPNVMDGAALLANALTFGVVSGKQGIPAGGSGPVIVEGEAYAMVANDGSGDIVPGAYLDVSNTAWGAGTTPANGAAAAAVSFEETSQASGAAIGVIAADANATKLQEFVGKTRARMINGTITAATVGDLPAASNTRTLCLVEVFNNPGGLGGS